MGLYDRDYAKADYRSKFGGEPQLRVGFPKVTPVVKWLLIINVAVFVPFFMIGGTQNFFLTWLSVYPTTLGKSLQLWRLITYQFLHDPDGFSHIFFNMLTLFFFGPTFERLWGGKKFLIFYLVCGAMGGVLYILLILARFLSLPIPLIGASGAILGLIAAGAILFPKAKVYVMGIFPVPLMVLAVIFALIAVMTIVRRAELANAGGEAAHLAGMATGAAYVLAERWRNNLKLKIQTSSWQRKAAQQRNLQLEVDRILQKVHEQGIHNLTAKERRILKKATQAERMKKQL